MLRAAIWNGCKRLLQTKVQLCHWASDIQRQEITLVPLKALPGEVRDVLSKEQYAVCFNWGRIVCHTYWQALVETKTVRPCCSALLSSTIMVETRTGEGKPWEQIWICIIVRRMTWSHFRTVLHINYVCLKISFLVAQCISLMWILHLHNIP